MRRTLSSAQTFTNKFITPVIWFALTILGSMVLFGGAWPEVRHSFFPAGANPPVSWALLIIWVISGYWIGKWSASLMRVRIEGMTLYISDYRQEVAVPLASIVKVTENRWIDLHPVTLELDRDTPFGRTIRFMPKIRYFVPSFFTHPVVEELRERASSARAAAIRAMPDLSRDRREPAQGPGPAQRVGTGPSGFDLPTVTSRAILGSLHL